MSRKELILFFLFFVEIQISSACKGCVDLDEYSFEKIITKFPVVLVKFDVAYPYGDQHDVYSRLASETATINDILITGVGVKDYGEKENEKLALKYGVTKELYPSVKLFKKDLDKPVNYTETKFTVDNLRAFIRDNADIYIGLPGCLEVFDKLASKFLVSDKQNNVLEQAERLSEKLNETDKTSAKIYILIMKKTIDSGKKFLTQEFDRVSKLLEGKISTKKRSELQQKLNIIRAFTIPRKDEL